MRGIILAGGLGTRLGSLTKTINKHCLPVYDRPMICWPLKTLVDQGCYDITVVSSPSGVGQIAAILGSGREFGSAVKISYAVQDKAGGIAEALMAAERDDRSGEGMAVILGDNIFLPATKRKMINDIGNWTFLAKVPDLSQFGVPSFHSQGGHVNAVFEKPKDPPSEYAVTGLYVFDGNVFSDIAKIKPSQRNELEITDLLHMYAQAERLSHVIVDGFWGDAGTVDGLMECATACKKWSEEQ